MFRLPNLVQDWTQPPAAFRHTALSAHSMPQGESTGSCTRAMTDNSTYDLIPSVEAMAELVSRIAAEQQASAATALTTQRVPAPTPPTSAYPKPLLLNSSAAEPAEPTPPGEDSSPAASVPAATAITVPATSVVPAAAPGAASVSIPVTQKPVAPVRTAK